MKKCALARLSAVVDRRVDEALQSGGNEDLTDTDYLVVLWGIRNIVDGMIKATEELRVRE